MRTLLAISCLLTMFASTAVAQPRLAVEVAGGQNLGLSSYIDNVVQVQGDRPVLVDEQPGTGIAFDLRFILSNWAVGGSVRLFDRDTILIHHRGTQDLPARRERPDGSIDDSGIDYVAVDPVLSPSPQTRPGDLVIVDVGAAYRFQLIEAAIGLYAPFHGGVVAAKVLDPNRPTILGFTAATGIGASYLVAPKFGLLLEATGHGLITPSYRPMADTARTSFTAGESTEQAVFSSMLYGSLLIGMQFIVR